MSASHSLNAQDKNFLRFAATTDMTEAHEGQLAQTSASSQNVKDFGHKLAQDFSNSYGRLLQIAQTAGEAIPRGIDVRQDRNISRLDHLRGRAFDAQFVRDQIREDQATIPVFRREAEHGQDPALRTWAQQALATVENDLMQARQLARAENSRT
ncbi:MAG TPA: DUF4142 domain-containing protein [Bryobacteraceae bacterium]|nr:DUF4142 domain-containing protein [Bryobacteraceae bacterium]